MLNEDHKEVDQLLNDAESHLNAVDSALSLEEMNAHRSAARQKLDRAKVVMEHIAATLDVMEKDVAHE